MQSTMRASSNNKSKEAKNTSKDFDFLTMIAGTTPDMLKLMDGVRTGEVGKAHQAHSEMENPADCYWDLHKSHTIRN